LKEANGPGGDLRAEATVGIDRRSCGFVLTRKSGDETQVLIVEHNTGHWGLPKGGQLPGEDDLQTAIRELREETGIRDVTVLPITPLEERYRFEKDGQPYNKVVVYFLATVNSAQVSLQAEELRGHAWVSFKEAEERIGQISAADILQKAEDSLR
jgi:8-oxo-dGTP pyrophosphatase MutT (NUDIX family)